MKEIVHCYAEVFATEPGKRVLEDLQKIWKKAPGGYDQAALSHLEGERAVVRYIEAAIAKGAGK